MKKIYRLSLLATTFAFSMSNILAQNYNGTILDTNNNPIPFANVVLQSLPDTVFITGGITDELGNFSFTSNKSGELLRISSIGYKTTYFSTENLSKSLIIEEENTEIGEVEIKAQRPITKLTGASMITTIEGSALSNSGTADEMLKKVPGLTKTSDGFEVVGKGAPIFYINGRKVTDLEELKRLHSDEIKSVEVITNPGAQYDATVKSVVKIQTLRRQGDGFGFDTHVYNNQDLANECSNPGGTFNFNYRHNNIDIFGMVDYWSWDNYNYCNMLETSYGKVKTDQSFLSNNHWHGDGMNYTLGANFLFKNNNSLGFKYDLKKDFDGKNDAISNNTMMEDDVLIDKYDTYENGYSKSEPQHSVNTYYNGKIGNLSIDFNGDYLKSKNSEFTKNDEISSLENALVENENTKESEMFASKLVLSYPAFNGQINLGSEISYVKNSNIYSINLSTIPSTESNSKEKNAAYFIEYQKYINKVGNFSAGIRYEHTNFEYVMLNNEDENLSRYTDDIFPSFSYGNQFGQVQVGLSYTMKTERPNYWSLSEAMNYVNRYTFQQGDAKLKNSTINSIGLSVRWKVLTLQTNYETVKNSIIQWSYIYNENSILIKHINLDSPIKRFVAYINASPTFGCYTMNYTVGVMAQRLKMNVEDIREMSGNKTIAYNKPIGIFNLSNIVRLKNNWQFEANVNIQTKGNSQTYECINNISQVGFVIQKSFLKNNALVLRASLEDAFKANKENIYVNYGNFEIDQMQKHNKHRLSIDLRYRFNSSDSKYKGTGAGQTVKSRM